MSFVSGGDRSELLAVLVAYEHMMRLSWPGVHPSLSRRKLTWPSLDETRLTAEVASLMEEADREATALRVFFKRVPGYKFWGGNGLFARDAGLESVEQLFGLTDFSKEVPWNRQAPLYRKDDEEVVASMRDKLNIVQRQDQTKDTIYLHAAKVPIRSTTGQGIGLMGAYTMIDGATAAKLIAARG